MQNTVAVIVPTPVAVKKPQLHLQNDLHEELRWIPHWEVRKKTYKTRVRQNAIYGYLILGNHRNDTYVYIYVYIYM